MPIGIDPKVDFAFKYVFGREQNESLLVLLLNAILDPPPDRRLVSLTILNPLLPQDRTDDKLSILDIRARDSLGRTYNVEMQLLKHKYLKERVLYYWAKLFAKQLTEADKYSELQPTISVLLLNDRLFPESEPCHQRFRLWNEGHTTTYSDRLEIHVIELPKFVKVLSELGSDLDGWLYFLQHVNQLELAAWPTELQFAGLHRAAKELQMLAATDLERQRYEDRLKAQLDHNSLMYEAREEGLELGREEGRQEGREKGWIEGQIQLCQELLNRPVSSRSELDLVPQEDKVRLLAELKESLRTR